MNIILTGKRQIGKSTAAENVLRELSCSRFGFLTRFDGSRESADRGLYMYSLDRSRSEKVIEWKNDSPEVYSGVFDRFGAQLLSEGGQLAVMDELGKFETAALRFKSAVEAVFDSETPVLAVVRINAEGWMQALKSRPDVSVITVTEQNRDDVPGQVLRMLREAGL
jgi:nucleoside-triphosphatase